MSEQDYLRDVLRVIRETFRPTDASGSMPVSTVAYLAKIRLGQDHTAHGFLKFKDVLARLVARGEIKTGWNSKNAFAIWLPENAPNQSYRPVSKPLRNPVWIAFVSEYPQGDRYFNRSTGDIRLAVDEKPGEEWVPITPINHESDKAAAHEFLLTHRIDLKHELKTALESVKWYKEFPEALATLDHSLAVEWKRNRSARVIGLVSEWSAANQIDPALLYESPGHAATPFSRSEAKRDDELRSILLTAVGQLSTDELLDLKLSARSILEAIRPDLLR